MRSRGGPDIGITERTFRLTNIPNQGWAWKFDDSDEIVAGKTFDSEKDALDYMNERVGNSNVIRTPISSEFREGSEVTIRERGPKVKVKQ